MTINKTLNGSSMEVVLSGRLDTESAPELEEAVKGDLSQLDAVTLDFADVEYISSAGLRAILNIKRGMRMGGEVTVKNASEIVREVFNVTSFNNIVNLA